VNSDFAAIEILDTVSVRSGGRVRSSFGSEKAGVDGRLMVVGKGGGRGRRDLQRSLIVVAATNFQTRELALASLFC
jgi:hypothetical protein